MVEGEALEIGLAGNGDGRGLGVIEGVRGLMEAWWSIGHNDVRERERERLRFLVLFHFSFNWQKYG